MDIWMPCHRILPLLTELPLTEYITFLYSQSIFSWLMDRNLKFKWYKTRTEPKKGAARPEGSTDRRKRVLIVDLSEECARCGHWPPWYTHAQMVLLLLCFYWWLMQYADKQSIIWGQRMNPFKGIINLPSVYKDTGAEGRWKIRFFDAHIQHIFGGIIF